MRPRRAAAGTILLTLALTACAGAGTDATTRVTASAQPHSETPSAAPDPTAQATPRPTPDATPDPTPVPTPVSNTFAVGDVITITQDGDAWADFTVVEVNQAAEFVDPDGYFNDTPSTDGYVYLSALVRYEAVASGVDYNPFDFQVFVDGQAVDGYAFAINGPEPDLGSGTLPAGRVAEGWLLYEVPPTGQVLLSYSGNIFLDEEPVFEVILRGS
jgi:hypothetical protein